MGNSYKGILVVAGDYSGLCELKPKSRECLPLCVVFCLFKGHSQRCEAC